MRPALLRPPLAAALGAWLLLGTSPALAQEDSQIYLTAMTGPLERLEACFEDLGVPLPSRLRRERLEKEMPFIGPGGLRQTGSLGMWMGPGEPGSSKPGVSLILPVHQDVAELREFTARGAKPVSSSSDTVRLKGMFLRRTEGFLLMGPMEKHLTSIDPLAAEERLSAPGMLAEIDVDLARWRKADPFTFYPLLQDKDEEPYPNPRSSSHSKALGRRIGTRIYERLLDRMRLTVMDGDSSLRLRLALEPLAPGEIAPLPRPAFPSGILGRVDIVYPSVESSQWLQGLTEEFMNAAEKDNIFAELERAHVNIDQLRALMKEAFEIFWIADAISIAVEPVKGKMVYHQVNQYRSPSGFTARLAAVVEQINELERKPGRRKTSFGLTTYSASGVRITRLVLHGKKLTLDFVDSGTTVRIVAAADTGRRSPGLFKAPPEGTLTSGFSGAIDLNATVDALIAGGKHLPLPLHARERLLGQRITWSTTAEGKAAMLDLDIPKPLIQAFFQPRESPTFEVDASEP